MIRKFAAEFLGTAILVFVAVGVATLMFGFKFAGASVAAGVVATALAFGLTLLSLVYLIGPVSGSHVNPAVTIGALLAGRIPLREAPCSQGVSRSGRRSATGSPSLLAGSSARLRCGERSPPRLCTAG
jgi:glycerol uptake facilitator-like aquaporin